MIGFLPGRQATQINGRERGDGAATHLYSNFEDLCSMFIQNGGIQPGDYTVQQPTRPLSKHILHCLA